MQPSTPDVHMLGSTFDGYNYIACEAGLIEFHLPRALPGGYADLSNLRSAWKHWIVEDLKLSEADFNRTGGWELRSRFYKTFLGMRIIPWDQRREIQRIWEAKG